MNKIRHNTNIIPSKNKNQTILKFGFKRFISINNLQQSNGLTEFSQRPFYATINLLILKVYNDVYLPETLLFTC